MSAHDHLLIMKLLWMDQDLIQRHFGRIAWIKLCTKPFDRAILGSKTRVVSAALSSLMRAPGIKDRRLFRQGRRRSLRLQWSRWGAGLSVISRNTRGTATRAEAQQNQTQRKAAMSVSCATERRGGRREHDALKR